MTQEEYQAIYQASRDSWATVTAKTMANIKKAYVNATKSVAEAIARAEKLGLSEITTSSMINIQLQLQKATWEIQAAIESGTPEAIEKIFKSQVEADKKFLESATVAAGADSVTKAGIDAMIVKINRELLTSLVSRVYSDGYNFSEAVISAAGNYQTVVKDFLAAGLAQGMDPVKIAKELTRYVNEGITPGGWGELKPGGRIPTNVDWRALRIVRSEITMAMHDAVIAQTKMNPGATGMVDWLRNGNLDWGCECPTLEANSPYKVDEVPGVPHPNCQCWLQPHVRDFDEFVDDLTKWAGGEPVDYIDTWYQNQYLTAFG